MTELQRILDDEACEGPSVPLVVLAGEASDAKRSLERIKEVLALVARASASDTWPTDEEWAEQLPEWFVGPLKGRSLDEVLKDQSLWDYGSWIDAMRHRGWRWHSSSVDGERWRIDLVQEDFVCSLDPLVYLARESGATSVAVV